MKPISSLRLSALAQPWFYLAFFCTTVAASSTAQASTAPLTQFCSEGNLFIPADQFCAIPLGTTVNGQSIPIILDATTYYPETNEVEYNLLDPISLTLPGVDGDQVNLNAVSVFVDPVLEFEASIVDLGDPSSFEVTFTSFPFAPNVSVNSFLSALLTDNSASEDGVSLTTSGLVTYEFLDAMGNVVDSGTNSLNLGSSISFPAGPPDSNVYGPLLGEGKLSCDTDGCGTVRLSLAFTGSGGGDSYEFSSRSEVSAVTPEPSTTLGLLFLGIGSVVGLKRKDKAKK